MNVTFLFGAGAESGLGLPSGPEYTRQTMLAYRSHMLNALHDFYNKRFWDGVGTHVRRKFFNKKSEVFAAIVNRALNVLQESDNQPVRSPGTQKLLELWNAIDTGEKNARKTARGDYMDELQNVAFPKIFWNVDSGPPPSDYADLLENMQFGGAVERDMSTLIALQLGDRENFWRMVNYFWGAYFCILLPLLDNCREAKLKGKSPSKKYRYVLRNLFDIAGRLPEISKEVLCGTESYYTALSQAFPGSRALTTNYTPFVQNIWKGSSAYLAGRLTQLMDPTTLRVVDFSREKAEPAGGLWIPFLMTQAPVKPLMNTCQIQEYAKALEFLRDETDLLVILGYSLGDSDNHINQMLQHYLSFSPEKRLLFCSYAQDDNAPKNAHKVYEKLRFLRGEAGGQIKVQVIQNAEDVIAAVNGKELVAI